MSLDVRLGVCLTIELDVSLLDWVCVVFIGFCSYLFYQAYTLYTVKYYVYVSDMICRDKVIVVPSRGSFVLLRCMFNYDIE